MAACVAGLAGTMTTHAADAWVQVTYACGVEDGRPGLRSVHVARQRETAERRFRDIAAKLAAAVTPPDDAGKVQHRLPLGK